MSIQYTEEEIILIKEMNHWNDEDAERFKSFLGLHSKVIPDEWSLEDVACAVAIFENAEQAFWFIQEEQDFAGVATLLALYDLSNLKEGQTTLAQHLVEEHEHYFKVKNGYVFFAG